jgi:hypothetical protein
VLAAVGAGSLYVAAGLLAIRREALRRMGIAAAIVGVIVMGLGAYSLSFLDVVYELRDSGLGPFGSLWFVSAGVAAVASIPLWVVYALGWRRTGPLRPLGLGLLAAVLLMAAASGLGLLVPRANSVECPTPVDIAVAVLANAAVLAMAAGLLTGAMASVDRRLFWPGVLLLVLLVVSRFFEYESNLMWKAAAFLACGLGIIGGGLKFESYLRRRRSADEQP